VFLMRAAGIPARVVAGYQGGEWNAKGNYLSVHQYDAHAWTEVWQAGKGWVQIDPTAVIAPERIEQGLAAAVQAEGSFLENEHFSLRNVTWLNGVRGQWDALQYGWQRWVLGYDATTQLALLQQLLGEVSWWRVAMFGGILILVIGLGWGLLLGLARRKVREAREHQLYRRFCSALAKRGVVRAKGQTPGDFAMQAAVAFPEKAAAITEFTRVYESLCYAPQPDAGACRQLQRILRQLGF
jgi:hypothetical protein